MADKISIASGASILLGADPIQSFSEDSTEALTARTVYDEVYENLLSYRNWTFAKETMPVSELQKTPLYGYKHVYRLPVSVIKLININNTQSDYRLVKGREIHTNLKAVNVTAIIKLDEDQLPANFVLAFKFILAAAMAPTITDDSSQADRFEIKGAKLLQQAANADAVQQPLRYTRSSPLLQEFSGGFKRY